MKGVLHIGSYALLHGSRILYRPVKTPFSHLNEALGGGFEGGKCTLIAGASGSGKTVLATQLVNYLTQQQIKTAFFTTDILPEEIVQRLASSALAVPFADIRQVGAIDWDEIESAEVRNIPRRVLRERSKRDTFERLGSALHNHLRIVNWVGQNKTIKRHFETAIDQLVSSGFNPEMILFDRIGGELGNYLHEASARVLVGHGERNPGRHVIVFARVKSPGKVERQVRLGKVANIVGISARENKVAAPGLNDLLARRQIFTVHRAANGPGGWFEMQQEFKHQRWAEVPRIIGGSLGEPLPQEAQSLVRSTRKAGS